MYIIEGRIVRSSLFEKQFICNLSKCKGACCWEGDFGAPVTESEAIVIEGILDKVTEYLSPESIDIITEGGHAPYSPMLKKRLTPLHENGACVYLTMTEDGIASCAFEKAWEDGKTSFRKPISCHLYPLRESKNKISGFDVLRYDEWDICKAACQLGAENRMPVFRFLKDAIVRRYGQSFYDQMEDIYATYFKNS